MIWTFKLRMMTMYFIEKIVIFRRKVYMRTGACMDTLGEIQII